MAGESGNAEGTAGHDEARDRKGADLALKALIDGTIAALSRARPDLAPIFVLAGEPAKAAVDWFMVQAGRVREQRAKYALGVGIFRAGISGEGFAARCEADEGIGQLATNVAIAAQDAVYQGKLEALALSLASALEDGSRVDEEILFTSVLAQIERPHIRVLAHMERDSENNNRGRLAELDPGLENVIDPLLSTLAGLGLIIRESPDGVIFTAPGPENAPYLITDFGKRLLQRVREAPVKIQDADR
jgi:hypothetical protein